MLDLMRKHAGTWLIKVILGAVIIVFTFWGIGSYRMRKGMRVAVVNGTTITADQYRDTYNRILEQLRQQFGNNLNEEMIKMFNVKQQAVESVINQALLLDEAERLHFRVTDEELAAAIRNTPAFQTNGQFDSRRYRRMLSINRLTPETFEANQRQAMLIGKLRSLVRGSIKVSDVEARELYNWRNASVKIEYVLFEPERYKNIQTTPEEIKSYFNDHQSAYKTDPLIKTRYLYFDPGTYAEKISVPDDEIADYYESHLQEYAKPKTVEVRHILIKTGIGDNPEKVQAAKQKALDVLKKIRSGEGFAEMAKKYSEDPSKDSGGYLGTFKQEALVAPFAEKAFSMKAGEVSEPVRTRYGWHIIKVEKVNPEFTTPLKDAKASIGKKLADEKAKILAYDDAEAVYDATFDENDLAKIAAEKGFKLQTTDFFARKGPEKGMKDAAAFAAAAFDLKAGEISEVKEIGGGYYIIQVVDEIPEKIPELSAVESQVRADLVKKKQDEKAQEDAKAFLKAVSGGQSMAEAGKTFNVKPAETGWFKRTDPIPDIGFEPAIIQAVFKLSGDSPLPDDAIKGKKGYYVTRFKARKLPEGEGFSREKAVLKQKLLRQKELEAFNALLASIKKRSDITISEGYQR